MDPFVQGRFDGSELVGPEDEQGSSFWLGQRSVRCGTVTASRAGERGTSDLDCSLARLAAPTQRNGMLEGGLAAGRCRLRASRTAL